MTAKRPYILWTLSSPAPEGSSDGRVAFVHLPFIQIEPLPEAVDLQRLRTCQSAIVTSGAAVAAIKGYMDRLDRLPFFAIGEATRDHLYEAGVENVSVPQEATGAELVKLLRRRRPVPPVFFPRGNLGGKQILSYLSDSKLAHYSPVVYRTVKRPVEELLRLIPEGSSPAVVALGSPSAVQVWQQVRPQLSDEIPVATIGPTTAEACLQAGLNVWLEAKSGSLPDMADQLSRHVIAG